MGWTLSDRLVFCCCALGHSLILWVTHFRFQTFGASGNAGICIDSESLFSICTSSPFSLDSLLRLVFSLRLGPVSSSSSSTVALLTISHNPKDILRHIDQLLKPSVSQRWVLHLRCLNRIRLICGQSSRGPSKAICSPAILYPRLLTESRFPSKHSVIVATKTRQNLLSSLYGPLSKPTLSLRFSTAAITPDSPNF